MLGVLSLFMLAFIVDAVTAQTVNPNPGVNAKSQTKSVPQTGNAKGMYLDRSASPWSSL